jgi:hypothetical protein
MGFLVAIIPLLIFLLAAPDRFIFGNLIYPRLNTLYRFDFPPANASMTMADKVGYLWNEVIAQPGNLLIFLAFLVGASILGYRLWRKHPPQFEMALVLLIVPCLAIGSFLPTPSWYQYFYAPLIFALIAVSFGLAYLTRLGGIHARWVIVAFTELVVLANLSGLGDYRRMSTLLHPNVWQPLTIHKIGSEVRAALEDGSGASRLAH